MSDCMVKGLFKRKFGITKKCKKLFALIDPNIHYHIYNTHPYFPPYALGLLHSCFCKITFDIISFIRMHARTHTTTQKKQTYRTI